MSLATDLSEAVARAARLVILKQLAGQNDGRMNDLLIQRVLDAYGYRRDRDWVKTQLRKLADLGAVTVEETGGVMIARLERIGRDHLAERSVIEGVSRPHEAE